MPLIVSAEEATKERRTAEVKGLTQKKYESDAFYITRFLGALPANTKLGANSGAEARKLPQAYLVEQPAYGIVPPHFHDTNQFQVFVHGDAVFGKKRIKGLTIHYAGGHTPYGPIEAGPNGAHYMTLRANWDSGGKDMPANRARLQAVPRRHRVATDIPLPDNETLLETDIESREILILEEDGLGAMLFDIGPGRPCALDMKAPGAGQYVLVVSGAIRHGTTDLNRNSCLFRYPQDEAMTVTGGAEGASVLLLQFPPEAV